MLEYNRTSRHTSFHELIVTETWRMKNLDKRSWTNRVRRRIRICMEFLHNSICSSRPFILQRYRDRALRFRITDLKWLFSPYQDSQRTFSLVYLGSYLFPSVYCDRVFFTSIGRQDEFLHVHLRMYCTYIPRQKFNAIRISVHSRFPPTRLLPTSVPSLRLVGMNLVGGNLECTSRYNKKLK